MLQLVPHLFLSGRAYDLAVADAAETTITLSFLPVPGARSYEYAISTTSAIAGFGAWTALAANKIITGLTAATQYWVKVRIVNGIGRGPASRVVTATTDAGGGGTVTDDFNRANGALGSNWTNAVGSCVIDTNRATANGFNAAHNISHWATAVNTFANDQFSQATFVTAGDSGGLCVRWAGTSGYKLVGPAGGNYFLVETTSGTDTDLDNFAEAEIANGDVVRLEATGTTIRVLVDGVEMASATDSDHASGSPGLCMNWNGGAFLDNWSGGPTA